jgi:hypothetical protein
MVMATSERDAAEKVAKRRMRVCSRLEKSSKHFWRSESVGRLMSCLSFLAIPDVLRNQRMSLKFSVQDHPSAVCHEW